MWKKVQNSTEEKPLEIEYNNGLYYARINFKLVSNVDDEGKEHKHWEYEEEIFNEKDYDEVFILNSFLEKTDYIWNVIREGDHDESYYADVISDRHRWRMRIRELN